MRVKTRLGQLVEEGRFTGGAAVFGYRFVKSGIITKKEENLSRLKLFPKKRLSFSLYSKKPLKKVTVHGVSVTYLMNKAIKHITVLSSKRIL